jgi:non-ribosomal peptide synthetase component F
LSDAIKQFALHLHFDERELREWAYAYMVIAHGGNLEDCLNIMMPKSH